MKRDLSLLAPTERFSSRAADYVRYRPKYPPALLQTLAAETGLRPEHSIVDIGSGTGFSSLLFLGNGNRVYGVEPNAEMRRAGEEYLARWPNFTSIAGSAEATSLPAASVDFVIAGQAFHWFDVARARTEFARILRPPGWVALFWNRRAADASTFMRAYEDVVTRRSRDYAQVRHDRVTAADVAAFYDDGRFAFHTFATAQTLDFDGLAGRTFSSSYMPGWDDPAAPALLDELRLLFAQSANDGVVTMQYVTELYCGLVHAP